MDLLLGGVHTKTHHSSAFCSGILIGTAIPALASGIYYSASKETHEQIPAWDALLYIYGVLFIPVIFTMLIGINLLAWARCHVNYAFIFELDVQSRIDYREYYEIPSFLFSTLCYAFWLSFTRTGSPQVSPSLWPLVWLALSTAVIFNPLPLVFRSSRFWLLKVVGKLLISGVRPVKFVDFWMGDQFCSLEFTLSNLYMFVCVYAKDFHDDLSICGNQSSTWPATFTLAALPFLVRLIQCIRRYADSGAIPHIINGGKYGCGIFNYFFYFLWRQQGTHYNPCFVLWLIFAIASSIYGTCWDLLMDWSLLRPRAKHFLLRDRLGYPNHVYLYYFAIITNCLIRFAWVFYVPERGPSTLIRTFIIAFLEMLRRVQWNFFRLENEHSRNIDQYVTEEANLSHSFDGSSCKS